jgi:thioredoxin-like negative regulator of GroEL
MDQDEVRMLTSAFRMHPAAAPPEMAAAATADARSTREAHNEAQFAEFVFGGRDRCLVLFGTAWASACQRARLALDELAAEGMTTLVVHVDVEALPALPRRYGVYGAPALVLFEYGQPVAMRFAEARKEDLRTWLSDHGLFG